MIDIIGEMPTKPGIYFFKDAKSQIIYIGKAKSIRKRVRSYFTSTHLKDPKTKVLVKNISKIDYLVVRSETEALLTEANLIKQHKPRYNVYLKDDKTFPYIKITNDDYPKIEIIRSKNLQRDKHIYFGPYSDAKYLRKVMKLINRIFPETNENYRKLKISFRPSKDVYQSIIKKIILFLKGRSNEVRDKILSQMNHASENMMYEDAAKYRDQLDIINNFIMNEKKISHDFRDRDIICVSSSKGFGLAMLIKIRNGHLIGTNKFNMKINNDNDIRGNTKIFIQQYYSNTSDFPQEVLLDIDINKKDKLEIWLSDLKKTNLKILNPKRGEKKELVIMCRKNCDLHLNEIIVKNKTSLDYLSKKIKSLKKSLNIDTYPRRIEAFDISHISGKFQVGGMVSYKDGLPYKKDYRKFRIKHKKGNNDYLSISEVIFRRYSRIKNSNGVFPDLILIDGGKGQLSSAKKSLVSLKLDFIPVIALAKKIEEVFIPNSTNPLSISKTSPGLLLLREIRDEVHRFSVKYHRSLRTKSLLQSRLLKIKGIGENRFKVLINTYGSLSVIKKKTKMEIFRDTRIPIDICRSVVQEIKD
tara:strand:- start:4814 stop:6565 length:1752 start_codon:yes stop_codon:yes gene_type:complete